MTACVTMCHDVSQCVGRAHAGSPLSTCTLRHTVTGITHAVVICQHTYGVWGKEARDGVGDSGDKDVGARSKGLSKLTYGSPDVNPVTTAASKVLSSSPLTSILLLWVAAMEAKQRPHTHGNSDKSFKARGEVCL